MIQDNHQREGVIIAGFGGQGIVFSGKLLAHTAMSVGKEVTYIPSYGAEVRGGTSNCTVVMDNEPIASPVLSHPDSLIIMNKASLLKFAPNLKPKGLLIYNRSLIQTEPDNLPDGVTLVSVPADEIAVELGNQKVANMVILGAYLRTRGMLEIDDVISALPHVLAQRYHHTLPTNTEALRKGAELALASLA